MKQEGNILFVEKGQYLRHKIDGKNMGKKVSLGMIYYKDGRPLQQPYQETIDDYEEVFLIEFNNEKIEVPVINYDDLVNYLIKLKYSDSKEFAILRQRDEKPEEFQEYNEYCNICKQKAKELI